MNEYPEELMNMERADLKRLAKNRLHNKQTRNALVLTSLVIVLIAAVFAVRIQTLPNVAVDPNASFREAMQSVAGSERQIQMWSMLMTFSIMFFVAGLNFSALDAVRNPDAKLSFGQTLLRVFNGRYFWLVLGNQILTQFATSLGFALLIIPGILLTYGLMLAPFVLYDAREHQEHVDLFKVLADSYRISRGHKFDLFVLNLSFFGWVMLGIFTAGIAFIWVFPYMQLTTAAYYEKLRLQYERDYTQAA